MLASTRGLRSDKDGVRVRTREGTARPAPASGGRTMAINPVPKHAWLAALVVALTIPPVAAATLASSPVTLAGGALVECSIANVTAAAATVTIRVLDNDAVLAHLGPV